MRIEVKIPSPGESISQVQVANWLVADGETVEKDQEIVEIDSDKATLAISAPEAGVVTRALAAGEMAAVGAIVATIEAAAGSTEVQVAAVKPDISKPVVPGSSHKQEPGDTHEKKTKEPVPATPLARRLMEINHLDAATVREFLSRYHLTREDVAFYLQHQNESTTPSAPANQPLTADRAPRSEERQPMTALRRKLAERLVAVKNQTAMLTTFNEINMTPVMELRNRHKDAFLKKHGVSLGFMSFFTKACALALKTFPQVNGSIEGDEIVLHHYADIGIAVSTPKGLMVPVLRDAETLSLAEIELRIKEMATRARDRKLTLDEMSGGTFTITNGGVFGSLLSTPILNPPQSAILGMHNIVERPIAVKGKVEIHPMMYVALSYDHRIVDGRESVGFLVKVKEILEKPAIMLYNGNDPALDLLGLS